MRVGIVFHKNPFDPPTRIDLLRLRNISRQLVDLGCTVEIIAPVDEPGPLENGVPVRPLSCLQRPDCYDVIKTCYHQSIEMVGRCREPTASRIVRVVSEDLPARDGAMRSRLLACQEMIHRRSAALILNNRENADRWRSMYGRRPPITLIPTGCPSVLPPSLENPYRDEKPKVLFLGSLAAPRMSHFINRLAERTHPTIKIHFIGRNMLHLYGGAKEDILSPLVVQHGEVLESQAWDFIRHASVGLALAAGPHPFDNDLSKIPTYLRGGLPVLSEDRVPNNDMILQTGYGRVFTYGNLEDMIGKLFELLEAPPVSMKEKTMTFMAREHSWEQRARMHHDLFRSILQ